ncbi:hypothetical protein B0I35DRAFT_448885 [Stachybotrys elegans]|uniref:Capsule polysaccharide biosynthesis protein n=1 Tax=Stachybotrys elegans TaxID=80388 RepID=A0A8K0WWH0_9HYPO|nr:hypothetical protein B0I35DRAFT_448885 [Stachybotrys elegans]
MASGISKLAALLFVVPPVAAGALGYTAWATDWKAVLQATISGPNARTRLLALLFVLFNLKSVPFSWTFRVFYAIFQHSLLRKPHELGPRALFKPLIAKTHAPLFEIDYNLHKTNSSYFADLDISRSHIVSYLCARGTAALARNTQTKLVLDPKTGEPAKGALGVVLGSVECSFKREIPPFGRYETWSRILAWDRKWLYVMTHFVPRGAAKPAEWLDPKFKNVRTRGERDAAGDWEKKVYASAVSKYVFKLDRYTIHPAIVLEASGLLPERPGGWIGGENQTGDESVDLSDVDLSVEGEWDWRRVEAQRRRGMEMGGAFNSLDKMHGLFDGGDNGAIGTFGLG